MIDWPAVKLLLAEIVVALSLASIVLAIVGAVVCEVIGLIRALKGE